MSSIGPQIPAHLLGQFKRVSDEQEDDESDDGAGPKPPKSSIGPQIPDHFQTSTRTGESEVRVYDDSEDDTGPRPSLETLRPRVVEVERERGSRPFVGAEQGKANLPRVLGPSLPGRGVTVAHDSDDDDDDDIGPKPFVGSQHSQPDAIKDFMEKEEKRRKAAEEALKPKAPKREEWMLVPPTSSSLLGNLDPTKLKGRQFSRGTTTTTRTDNDMSLWTETPAERLQRITDEVQGKKRRVTDAPGGDEDEEEVIRKRRRKQEEDAVRKSVDDHTRTRRGAALVEQHAEVIGRKSGKEKDKDSAVIWDHARDMGVGGRLLDDDKRNKMVNEAKGLGDRFNSGKSGGFL